MNEELYRKIQNFQFDGSGAKLSFLDRLARENGWDHGYALRAMQEYRRFIYLVASSNLPATPSDQVDQVWHLHLLYTHSYWNDLCKGILNMEIHHGPTRGGGEEKIRFFDQYASTLERYESLWGNPPSDLWPSPEARMSAIQFQRVDLARHWVIRKWF